MLKERSELIGYLHRFIDISLTVSAFVAAYLIKLYILPEPHRGLISDPNYSILLLMIIIIWYPLFSWFGFYKSYRKRNLKEIIVTAIKAVTFGIMALVLVLYLFKIQNISRMLLGIFYVLNIAFLVFCKSNVYQMLARFRSKGYNFKNVLIVGSKDRAKDVIRAIHANASAGFRIIGCLEVKEELLGMKVINRVRVINIVKNLYQALSMYVVDELIFAMPLKMIENSEKYVGLAEEMGVPVRIIPDWQIHQFQYTPEIARIGFEEFMGVPTMALQTTRVDKNSLFIKDAFDYTFSLIALILFLPFFPLVVFAIKITSSGPVFFKQERLGLHGRIFSVYKFRTMIDNAEFLRAELDHQNEAVGPVFKIKKDPRIVPFVGTFLRKTNLDEIPQLINVLRGEMSLVGPRPPLPSEVKEYKIWHRRRLSMKPGITCIWQAMQNRNDVSFEEWMNMDLTYIDNWKLRLDFKILFQTAGAVLLGTGR